MVTADKVLVCRECGSEFIFSAGEQAFYAERGFVPPSRCPNCRATRRAARTSVQPDTDTSYRPLGGERRELFPAVCAECGRETMVPFQPRAGRAVYCRDCFSRRREAFGLS